MPVKREFKVTSVLSGYSLGGLIIAWIAVSWSAISLAQSTDQPTPTSAPTAISKADAAQLILREFSPPLATWQQLIKRYEDTAFNRFLSPADAQSAIQTLEGIRPKLRVFVDQLKPKFGETTARLEKLGPAPKENEKEGDGVATQRKAIANEVATYDGLIKRAEVLFVQAGQAISNYNATRRKQFLVGLLRRSDNLGNAAFWSNGATLATGQVSCKTLDLI